jgi:hypothetical protein
MDNIFEGAANSFLYWLLKAAARYEYGGLTFVYQEEYIGDEYEGFFFNIDQAVESNNMESIDKIKSMISEELSEGMYGLEDGKEHFMNNLKNVLYDMGYENDMPTIYDIIGNVIDKVLEDQKNE